MSHRIVIRCDASDRIGYRSVRRCLALADELASAHRAKVSFLVREDAAGAKLIEQHGYSVVLPPADFVPSDYGEWLATMALAERAQALVLDVNEDQPRPALRVLRQKGLLLVALDDFQPHRIDVDLAFYAPSAKVKELDWVGFQGEWRVGWDWVVLGRGFASPPAKPTHARPSLLITTGHGDPSRLTLRAMRAVDRLEREFDSVVVAGSGFPKDGEFDQVLFSLRHHMQLYRNVEFMAPLMAEADLAAATPGVTAYELGATSTPAIYLCDSRAAMEAARPFVEAGLGTAVDMAAGELAEIALAKAICELLDDKARRRRVAEAGRRVVDGQGARRVAEMIVANLGARRR